MSALSPAVVAAVHDLELAARLVVEGMRAGGHKSPFHGYNAEFQQHRSYRAGDDLKYLDWKLLGRTDRLYSKQFRETTSMSVMIVLDSSASMAFPENDATRLSKFRYGSIVAAALAWLISTQGDAVGFMSMSGTRLSYLPARGGRPHLRSLIHRIDQQQPDADWQPERVITRSAELLKRRGLLLLISDFYDAEDETRRALRRVAKRGHDVALLQLVSPEEIDFPYRGDLEFQDLESGKQMRIDAGAVQNSYRTAMSEFLQRCRTLVQRDGLDYALLSTHTPPERALRSFLLSRGAMPQITPAVAGAVQQ